MAKSNESFGNLLFSKGFVVFISGIITHRHFA